MKTTSNNRAGYVLVPVVAVFCAALLSAGVTRPAYAQVLVSNTGQTPGYDGSYHVIFWDIAQEFTTGSNIDGYRLTSIDLNFVVHPPARNVKPSVKINLSNDGIPGGATLGELTKPGGLTAGLNRFEAPAGGIDLVANTSYIVWTDNSANIQIALQNALQYILNGNLLRTTDSNAEDSGASTGWSIGDSLKVRRRVQLFRNQWRPVPDPTWTSFRSNVLRIGVNGSALDSYDSDGDGLIEIGSLAQLNAIRWDLDGDGAADNDANAARYAYAVPNAVAGMGCPTTADDADDNDCIGYELIADLDFDTNGDGAVDAADNYWSEGAGWAPIGSPDSGNEFIATFEGNDHTIDNLYIDVDRSGSQIGLFGVVGTRGQVRNVGVRKVSVYGFGLGTAVGGLVGLNRGSIVTSYATGLVGGEGPTFNGGLAGANTGSIVASYATGTVKSLDGNAGGLVGLHGAEAGGRSIITASYATGAVARSVGVAVRIGMKQGVGGLVGLNLVGVDGGRSIITASYATGNVWNDGGSNVGGLVGFNVVSDGKNSRNIIAASYATGNVENEGDSNVGGLVGQNLIRGSTNSSIITASYATGNVWNDGDSNVGGLVGRDSTSLNANSSIDNSYWNTETSGQSTSDGGGGKTTRELVTPTGYAGIYANWNLDLNDDYNNDDPWDFGAASEYPMLRADFNDDGVIDAVDLDPQRRAVSPPAATTDFNGDGQTDFADFFLFADAYGGTDSRFDLDGSGTVDFADFFKFIDAFGT